jgi:SAM-dependent methyltransferase
MDENMESFAVLGRTEQGARNLLDLGCDAGGRTVWVAERLAVDEMHGVEIDPDRAELARAKGIEVVSADLSERLPFDDESFDLVMSNQVIEHVPDTDSFVGEAFRVLRPGGCAIVSTENLSAWHNVGSLVLGWQPFSLTNVSEVSKGIGNPLGIHRGEPGERRGHLRVMAPRGLRELFETHGFRVEALVGAGYFPLPRALARLDVRHAAFLTIKVRRPMAAS